MVQQATDVPATGSHHAPQPPATLLSPSSTKLDLDQGVEGLGRAHTAGQRSEERRVGKECEVPCRSRWSPYH